MAEIKRECDNWICANLNPGRCGLEDQAENQVEVNAARSGFVWKEHCWKNYADDLMATAEQENCPRIDQLKETLKTIEPEFEKKVKPSEPEENPTQPGSPAQKY